MLRQKGDMELSSQTGKAASTPFRLAALVLCLLALLAGCKNDYTLYERHRGSFPEDYKDKVRAAVEKGWPAPRKFQVIAITEPIEGFLIAKNYWKPTTFRDHWKYGAWLGCIHIKGIKSRGADFQEMDVPYMIDKYATAVELIDEPDCRNAPYEPWTDMQDGTEAGLPPSAADRNG